MVHNDEFYGMALSTDLHPFSLNHPNIKLSTLTKHDCALGLVGVLVSSDLSSHFNSVPLTSLKVRDGVVDSIWSLDGLVVCWWRRCDCNIGIVATLWCHGNVCSTVVVAGASPIDNGGRFLSITWNIGQQAHWLMHMMIEECQ